MNKIRFILLCIIIVFSQQISAQFSVTGNYFYEYKVGSGIDRIYMLNGLKGSLLNYSTANSNIIRFYTYTSGLSDKTLIPDSDISSITDNGKTIYTITKIEDNRGYIAEINGNLVSTVGILDYNLHLPEIRSVSIEEPDDKCDFVRVIVDKTDLLIFFSPAVKPIQLSRFYSIEYNTLDTSTKEFSHTITKLEGISIGSEETVDAPFIDTKFVVSDFIASSIGLDIKVVSNEYNAISVKGFIEAKQITSTHESSAELGGSAPAKINFEAYANTPVAYYYTWLIYNKKESDDPIARYTDQNFSYTFSQSGKYKVSLEVADRSSTCTDVAEIEFSFEESKLDIPNFFVPGDGENGAKKFKVSYKSLVKFKGTIFNSWGVKLFEWTNPAEGWDGKYKGNYVPTGVYYYIIVADGSDGKKYKKGGDINIVKQRQ